MRFEVLRKQWTAWGVCCYFAVTLTAMSVERLFDLRQLPPTVWEQTDTTPRTMVCPPTATPPILDGKLDDACWQQAGATSGFLKCDDNIWIDLPAQGPTEVRFCRDDANLYFGWRLYGEEAQRLAGSVEPGKTPSYTGRGARFVIILQLPGSDNWMRWSFHPTGGVASFSQDEGDAYAAPCRTAAAPFDEGAIVEVAIPFDSPQLRTPQQGEWWRLQFGRVDNHEWTAFPNSRGIFEQPVRYGYLLFDDLSKAATATPPVPSRLELYGEQYAYDADQAVTQFIAATAGLPLDGHQLRFTLTTGDTVVATIDSAALTQPKVAVAANLHGLAAGTYRLRAELLRQGRVVAKAPVGDWPFTITADAAPAMPFPDGGIPLRAHPQTDQPGATWPIATAVPLPRHAVADVATLGVYENGDRIPANIVVRSYWEPTVNAAPELAADLASDIKWVGVAFNVRYDGKTPRQYVLKQIADGQAEPPSPLRLVQDGSRWQLISGPARFDFDAERFAGIDAAWRDANGDGEFGDNERRVLAGGGAFLVDDQGERYEAVRDTATAVLEEVGPARIVVAVSGWYRAAAGARLCRFQTHVTAYAGLPWVRIDQRTILTYDTRQTHLRDLGFTVAMPQPRWSLIGLDHENTFGPPMNTPWWSASVHQDRHDHFRVLSAAGANAADAVVETMHEGFHGLGRAAFWDAERNATEVILRDFWQKYPKELEVNPTGVTLHFWPQHGADTFGPTEELRRANLANLLFAHEGDALEMQIPPAYADWFRTLAKREYVNLGESLNPGLGSNGQGVVIGNSFLLNLGLAKDGNLAPTPALFQRDPQAFADPVFACATGALGPLRHQDRESYPAVERLLDYGYLFQKRFFETTGAWGMFNTYDMFSQALPAVRYPSTYRMWISSHHQQTETAWLMYFRSGSPEWLTWARGYSDHFMNVDTCNYDDPAAPMIGTTPDGKHLVGGMIHMAGASYHCKAYVHWGSECNAATHWVSPHTYLLDFLLLGDYAGRDVFRLWLAAIDRVPLAAGASRDVNNTMAQLVPAYRFTGDPQLLLYIHRTGDELMKVAFKDHSSGHYHPFWPRRYYELTRDPRAVARTTEYADSGYGGIYADMLAFAWRATGDRKYLDMRVNGTYLSSRAIYLNPQDAMDGYSALRPLAGGSFELMSLPYFLAALHDAAIPLAWQSPAEPGKPQTLAVDQPTKIEPGVWRLAPDPAAPLTLTFSGIPSKGYADYVGASLSVTTIDLRDADGQILLASSIGPGLDRSREAVVVDPSAAAAPWALTIGSAVTLTISGPAAGDGASALVISAH